MTTVTSYENNQFLKDKGFDDLLTKTADWISNNMSPEDIFDKSALEEWAVANGYQRSRVV